MSRRALTALGLALWAAPLAAQDTIVVQVPSQLSAVLGDRMTVPVTVDMSKAGSAKLGSYTIRVSWNGTALSYSDYQNGSFAVPVVRTDSAYLGVVWLTAASPAGQTGVVHVADLMLNVSVADVDTVRIQATEMSAAGSLVNLMASAALLTRGGAFCPALGRWGDLDNDGLANSRDALAILSKVVDLPVPTGFNVALGDVDGDGLTNSRDALILLSYAVGLSIPGQRVLLVAAGSCATSGVPNLVVLPDTADLAVGQQTRLVAMSRDGAGNLTALTGLLWQTVDPTIALADGDGNLLARKAGTTRVVAQLGPGVRIEVPVIVRAQRGTWYVDAQRAVRNPIQLGTMKWPFSHPWRAFPIVAEGDTVRLAPGTYDQHDDYYYYYYDYYIRAGAVIIGDTLPDGTRPILRYNGTGSSTALYFWPGGYIGGEAPQDSAASAPKASQEGGARGEVRNLVIENFYQAIVSDGLRNLIVENVRIVERQSGYGYGVLLYEPVDTLRVLRSTFLGDSTQYSYYGVYVGDGAGIVDIRDSEFRHWYYGAFYGYDVDSLDMRRNLISRNTSTSVYLRASSRASVSATFVENRFVDNAGSGVQVYDGRRVTFQRNVHANRYYPYRVDAPYIGSGYPVPGTRLAITGDSVRMGQSGYYWLDAEQWDSILVDAVVVTSKPDTANSYYSYLEANYVRVTNSKFLDLSGGPPVNFYGKRLVVDNSAFIGCNVCTWSSSYGVAADDYGTGGPAVSVTNSTFSRSYRAVYVYGAGTQGGPVTLANNTVDSVSYAFDIYADSVTVSDNVVTRLGAHGLYLQPSNVNNPYTQAQILRNQVSCHAAVTSGAGIIVYYNGVQLQGNAVRNCQYGIDGYQSNSYPLVNMVSRGDTVFPRATTYYNVGIRMYQRVRPTIVGARIVGGYFGIDLTPSTTDSIRIDSSAVSGAGQAAIQLYYAGGVVTGVRNNIAGNLLDGIYNVGTSGARSFTLGKFNSGGTGNGRWAINSSAAFNATQNWWGLATGPGGAFGTPGTSADSVSSANVNTASFLTAEPTDVPPLAPPAPGPVVAGATAAVPSLEAAVSPPTVVDPAAERSALEERAAAKRAAHEARRAVQAAEDAELRRVADELKARHLRERAEAAARVRPPQ